MNSMPDDELDRALEHWQVADPPARLEANTMNACRPGFGRPSRWSRWLTMRVAVPLPVAAAVLVVLAGLSAMLAWMEFRTRPVQTPGGIVARGSADLPWGGLQPVTELRPRIIRGDQ
jgi:hypothetical protein